MPGRARSGIVQMEDSHAIPRFQLDYLSFRDLHKILCCKPRRRAVQSRFACYLAVYFPEVAEHIDESDFGILHLEVGVLKLRSRSAIINGDWEVLTCHFAFVRSVLENGGHDLRDAVRISYLGSLFYGETGRNFAAARCLLPPRLSRELDSIEKHYEDLVG